MAVHEIFVVHQFNIDMAKWERLNLSTVWRVELQQLIDVFTASKMLNQVISWRKAILIIVTWPVDYIDTAHIAVRDNYSF